VGNKKRNLTLLFLTLFFITGFLSFSRFAFSDDLEQIIISEVLIGTDKASEEFIELFNPTDDDIDLQDLPLKLHIVNSKGDDVNKKLSFKDSDIVEAGKYYLISSTDYYEKYKGKLTIGATYSASLVSDGAVYISDFGASKDTLTSLI
jgi:hypothetical protein